MEPQKITPFLTKKWIQGFHFFDINKDGVFGSDDLAHFGDYISKKTGANEQEAANTRQEWVKWMGLLQSDTAMILNKENFLKCLSLLHTENKERHIKENIASSSDLFDRIDFNKDGKISFGELSLCYEAAGITDTDKIREAFDNLDKNGDGVIEREEFVQDFVNHFCNPDPVSGKSYFISSVME